jgi:hypothetical protein
MIFNFPRTKFVDLNGLVNQVLHMGTEQAEIEEVMLTPDIAHTALEIMDKYHSCETALRILQEKYGINLAELRRDVERKNALRGYYEQ